MDEISKFVAYATFSRITREDGHSEIVSTAAELERLRKNLDRRAGTDQDEAQEELSDVVIELSDVGKGVWHFYDQLKSYYQLARVSDVIPDAFLTGFFRGRFVEYAKKNFEEVEEYNGFIIYGLSLAQMSYVNHAMNQWSELEAGLERLPTSTLLSLVASFDSSFSDFAKSLLRARPQRYSGSDRMYSVGEIVALGSLDDLIAKVIDDEVDQLMNKSHTDQVVFFEKSFKVSIRDNYERWPIFIEVFERRNLAAHGSLRVNERYLNNCKAAGLVNSDAKLGDKLPVDVQYLDHSIDVFIEFGVLLAFSAWQKQVPSAIPESFSAIVEISYSLLREDHPEVARRILDYALSVSSKGASDAQIKMMTVNLAIAHKKQGRDEDTIKVLSGTDWSAASHLFRLCVAAVREEIEEACSLLPLVHSIDEIEALNIREWPAFSWVCKNTQFKAKFEEVFGEPFEAPSIKATAEVEVAVDETSASDAT